MPFCGGLWSFAVVCGSLGWFAMVCGGLSYSDTGQGAPVDIDDSIRGSNRVRPEFRVLVLVYNWNASFVNSMYPRMYYSLSIVLKKRRAMLHSKIID